LLAGNGLAEQNPARGQAIAAKFPCYLLVNPRGQRGKKEKRGKKKGKKRREKEKESNSL
jgi:hypothetical protein